MATVWNHSNHNIQLTQSKELISIIQQYWHLTYKELQNVRIKEGVDKNSG